MIAYKAETDSLRAAMMSVQKTERVKEDAVHRRFQALEKALMAAEGSAKAWKERAAAVENLLKQVRPTGTERIGIGYGCGDGSGSGYGIGIRIQVYGIGIGFGFGFGFYHSDGV